MNRKLFPSIGAETFLLQEWRVHNTKPKRNIIAAFYDISFDFILYMVDDDRLKEARSKMGIYRSIRNNSIPLTVNTFCQWTIRKSFHRETDLFFFFFRWWRKIFFFSFQLIWIILDFICLKSECFKSSYRHIT